MSNFPRFWLLGSLLCLSLATSLVACKNRTSVNFSKWLNVSEHLMMECNKALKNWQGSFICKLENYYILPSENENEKKIFNACMAEKKPESCWSGDNNAINETLCRETIHTLLMPFAEQFKSVPNLLAALNDMMQVLKINNITIEEAPDKSSGFYSKDLKQCKSLLILQQFAEIVHRTISYLLVD